MAGGSRWKPAKDVVDSGAPIAELGAEQRGMRAVWEGKFLKRSLQKQGVVDG